VSSGIEEKKGENLLGPPISQLPILVVSTAGLIQTVTELMSGDCTETSKVEILGPGFRKEGFLQDSSRKDDLVPRWPVRGSSRLSAHRYRD